MRNIWKLKDLSTNALLTHMHKNGDKEILKFIWSCDEPMCGEWGEFGKRISLAYDAYQRTKNFSLEDSESPQSWKHKHVESYNIFKDYCTEHGLRHKILDDVGATFTNISKVSVTCSCGHSWCTQAKALISSSGCAVCSGKRHTKKYLEDTVKGILLKESLSYTLVGWVGDKVLVSGRLHMDCKTHGEFFTDYTNFVRLGTRCPVCNKSGFSTKLPAKFYLLEISDGTTTFLGYGITRKIDLRLQQHRNSMANIEFKIVTYKTWDMLGSEAKDLENKIKSNFKAFPNNIKSFTKESAHIEDYCDIVDIIGSVATKLIKT